MGASFAVLLTDLLNCKRNESRWKIDDRMEVHGCTCMQTSTHVSEIADVDDNRVVMLAATIQNPSKAVRDTLNLAK